MLDQPQKKSASWRPTHPKFAGPNFFGICVKRLPISVSRVLPENPELPLILEKKHSNRKPGKQGQNDPILWNSLCLLTKISGWSFETCAGWHQFSQLRCTAQGSHTTWEPELNFETWKVCKQLLQTKRRVFMNTKTQPERRPVSKTKKVILIFQNHGICANTVVWKLLREFCFTVWFPLSQNFPKRFVFKQSGVSRNKSAIDFASAILLSFLFYSKPGTFRESWDPGKSSETNVKIIRCCLQLYREVRSMRGSAVCVHWRIHVGRPPFAPKIVSKSCSYQARENPYFF